MHEELYRRRSTTRFPSTLATSLGSLLPWALWLSCGLNRLDDESSVTTRFRTPWKPNTVDFRFVRTTWIFPWSRLWASVLAIWIQTPRILTLGPEQLFRVVFLHLRASAALNATTEKFTLFEQTWNQQYSDSPIPRTAALHYMSCSVW